MDLNKGEVLKVVAIEYIIVCAYVADLGPVVRSIVSLTSSLRGQLVKCFTTLLPNTLIFFVEKMIEAFALHTFSTKILAYFR